MIEIQAYLVVVSLLQELKLLRGLSTRLLASAFTLLQIRVKLGVLHLQTTGQLLDLSNLDKET